MYKSWYIHKTLQLNTLINTVLVFNEKNRLIACQFYRWWFETENDPTCWSLFDTTERNAII